MMRQPINGSGDTEMTKFEQALADMHKQFADMQKRQEREHAEALSRMEAQTAEFIASLKGE